MPENIPLPAQSHPSEKNEWPEDTDQIQAYLKTQNLLIPLDLHQNIFALNSAKGLLLGVLLSFLLLLVPITNDFIIRIIIGGLILGAGVQVYNQSMLAIRHLFKKNTVQQIFFNIRSPTTQSPFIKTKIKAGQRKMKHLKK